MTIPTTPKPNTPVLSDVPIGYLQDALINGLPWLTHAFGRAQRIVRAKDGSGFHYPAIYLSGYDYINLMPDQNLGNFSFFYIRDSQDYERRDRRAGKLVYDCSLIFWFNLETATSEQDRNSEKVKAEILKVLNNAVSPKGNLSIELIYELSENIYSGFDLQEVELQHLMHPYCGFRFDGKLTFTESCTKY